MKTRIYQSILAASLALAWLPGSASAVTLPVAQDNSSTHAGTFKASTGKATSLSVAPNCTAYVQFDLTKLPPSVTAGTLRNARLRLYATKLTAAGGLSVSHVTTAWSETNAGRAATVGGLIATIPGAQLATKRFVVVDVTAAVNNWLSGVANNGIAISSTSAILTLGSKEGARTGYPAELEIDVASNGAQGPQGLAGPVGATGPVGPQGPAGAGTLTDGSVTTPKLANGAVTVAKLDAGIGLWSVSGGNVSRPSGNVSIGSAGSPGQLNINSGGIGNVTVHIQGRSAADTQLLTTDQNGAATMRVGTFGLEVSAGTAFKPGGGAFAVLSDARLKHNVEPLTGALDHLLRLRSVTYEYNDATTPQQPAGRQTGFVAQEVEGIFPNWVGEGADGYKFIAVQGFESLTVAALRELRVEKDEQIKSLTAENAQLKKRLDETEARDSASLARLTALEKAIGTLVVEKSKADPEVRRGAATINP